MLTLFTHTAYIRLRAKAGKNPRADRNNPPLAWRAHTSHTTMCTIQPRSEALLKLFKLGNIYLRQQRERFKFRTCSSVVATEFSTYYFSLFQFPAVAQDASSFFFPKFRYQEATPPIYTLVLEILLLHVFVCNIPYFMSFRTPLLSL